MRQDVSLIARGLARRYGGRAALEGFDLTLHRGDCLGLLGLNGAGKSTTLRLLAGVLAPHAGSISICGHDLAREPLAAKRRVGYLPDVPPLFPDARVDDFLRFAAALRGVRDAGDAVNRAKARCGLGDVGARPIRHLSKGYQQRVGLAQAIVHEPDVLVLDEPTVGLDPVQIRDVRELVRALARQRTVILSTHLLPEVQQVCTRVAVLHQGRLVHEGPVAGEGCRLQVRVGGEVTAAALAALPAVRAALPGRDGAWLLEVGAPEDAEAVACALVAAGLGLRELRVADGALEETFLALTRGAARAEAAA